MRIHNRGNCIRAYHPDLVFEGVQKDLTRREEEEQTRLKTTATALLNKISACKPHLNRTWRSWLTVICGTPL